MMRKIVVLFLFLCLFVSSGAQKINKGKHNIYYGTVVNHLTGENVLGARVYLLKKDSTVVDSMTTENGNNVNSYEAPYLFEVPHEGGEYILRVEAKGYETFTMPLTIKRSNSRNWLTEGPEVRLRRSKKRVANDGAEDGSLGEATVVATKLKFYHKGDTLVYNADAFDLAEGSMLDALIRQLPGVELRDNGEIYVNGKKVESLLLNGDDFFRGNNQIMLDNLPSYMVQNVQIYDKASKAAKLLGQRVGDEEYVMDVRLKKTYEIGWIGHVEAGYGTEDRYLGRLFGMRFTSQSRLTFFANQNNLNDTRQPGRDTSWTPDKMPTGRQTVQMAGLDYHVKDRRGRYVLMGNAVLSHKDRSEVTRTASENYFEGGNTFGRSEQRLRAHDVTFKTAHEFDFSKDAFSSVVVKPEFSCRKWNNLGSSAVASFLSDPSAYGSAALLDSIRRPFAPGSELRRMTQYRQVVQQLGDGHAFNGKVEAEGRWKLKGVTDVVGFNAEVGYDDSRARSFLTRQTDYSANEAQGDFRRLFTDQKPDNKTYYNITPAYIMSFPRNVVLVFSHALQQAFRNQDANTYRLDRLDDWGSDDRHVIGALPSDVEQLRTTLDAWNSYTLREITTENISNLRIFYNTVGDESKWWGIDVSLPLTFEHKRLSRYCRADFDGSKTHRMLAFTPSVNLRHLWHKEEWYWRFYYKTTAVSPEMTSLFDIENTLDPLNVYKGNADLKNSFTHSFYYNLQLENTKKQRSFSFHSEYEVVQNAVVWAYNYDRTTGRRNYVADNVNGNYKLAANVEYEMPLDRKKHLTVKVTPYGAYNHGVDLVSTDETMPVRSSVGVVNLAGGLKLDYKFGEKARLGASGYIDWYDTHSSREDFTSVSPYSFSYGLEGRVNLPWEMELSSDLKMYSRRGYNDRSANTDDLVWNARLSKRIPKLSLTLAVDGFDLLHQLSNRTVALNSQGRVETWRNTLPSYFFFHIVYKLNVKPRHK